MEHKSVGFGTSEFKTTAAGSVITLLVPLVLEKFGADVDWRVQVAMLGVIAVLGYGYIRSRGETKAAVVANPAGISDVPQITLTESELAEKLSDEREKVYRDVISAKSVSAVESEDVEKSPES